MARQNSSTHRNLAALLKDHHFRPLRIPLLSLSLTLLVACAQPVVEGPVDAGGMALIEHSGLDAAKIKPGADLSKYNSLLIEGLNFTNVKLVDPNTSNSARYKDFALSDTDKQFLNKLFMEQVTKSLTKGSIFGVATQPGAGTLRVVTELVELDPNAPRESDERFTSSVRNDTYSRGAGSLTLESKIYDSVTGEQLAELRDEYTDSETWGNNNSVTNTAAVRRAFTRWGSTLQRLKAATPESLKPKAQ